VVFNGNITITTQVVLNVTSPYWVYVIIKIMGSYCPYWRNSRHTITEQRNKTMELNGEFYTD